MAVKKHIPGIHEIHPFPCGFSQSFIHGIIDTLVGFADPIYNMFWTGFNRINSTIGWTSVDHDELDPRILQVYNTPGSLPESFSIIKYYCNNWYDWIYRTHCMWRNNVKEDNITLFFQYLFLLFQ